MSLNEQFGWPFILLNDEQMQVGVEHQQDQFIIEHGCFFEFVLNTHGSMVLYNDKHNIYTQIKDDYHHEVI